MFDRINQLVDWFKAYYRDPIPGVKHLPNKMQQPPPAPSYPEISNSRSHIHPPYIPTAGTITPYSQVSTPIYPQIPRQSCNSHWNWSRSNPYSKDTCRNEADY
ncbi:uncharacterized protein LOC123683225 [Harmonia axyridis]|uniref:uncharacterized protein LOC123683225 n=1 Tax=Harmonia axyridis TaxID=115357 RepID=UPI001E2752A5|nr:uncharacterized protein LOC123683225 [Harmonia axyridis]